MTFSHDLYTDADKTKPSQICDGNGQVALSMCKVCRRVESELNDTPICDNRSQLNETIELNVHVAATASGTKFKDMWCFDPNGLTAFVELLFEQYANQLDATDQPPTLDRYDHYNESMEQHSEGQWVAYDDVMAVLSDGQLEKPTLPTNIISDSDWSSHPNTVAIMQAIEPDYVLRRSLPSKLSAVSRVALAHSAFGNPIPVEAYRLIDAIENYYLQSPQGDQSKFKQLFQRSIEVLNSHNAQEFGTGQDLIADLTAAINQLDQEVVKPLPTTN